MRWRRWETREREAEKLGRMRETEVEQLDDERKWVEKLGDGMLGRGPRVNPNVEQRSTEWLLLMTSDYPSFWR